MKKLYIAIISLSSLIIGCQDQLENYQNKSIVLSSVEASVLEMPLTRTLLEDGNKIVWELNDKIGIFSDTDNPVPFTKTETKDIFTCESSLRGEKFFAFYPYGESVFDQNNRNILHFTIDDSVTAGGENPILKVPMIAISNGEKFSFKQTSGVLHISITGSKLLSSVKLNGNCNERINGSFIVNLNEESPILSGNGVGESLEFKPESPIQLSETVAYDVFFILPPMKFKKGFSVTFDYNHDTIVKSTDKEVTISRSILSNYTLDLDVYLSELEEQQKISFEDPLVKDICIANWDTNSDGELSYKEAANIIDISYAFFEKTDIKSFNEFQYFTGLKDIPKNAFKSCVSLESIILPNTLKYTSSNMFDGCVKLSNIIIPDSLTSIGSYTFNNCSNLTKITLPSSLTTINENSFHGCSNLTNITIPERVTSIGVGAFYGCSNLTNITIPESVTFIGGTAFYDCISLTSLTIPEGVREISGNIFDGCINLVSLTIPKSVTHIGGAAFNRCSKLSSISLPKGITIVEEATFSGCSSLTSIEIPKGVTTIGERAFKDCVELTSIGIPESVSIIEGYAFSGCTSLTGIEIPDGVTDICQYCFENCSSLTNISLPESVVLIYSYAFRGCGSLTSITIPKNVKEIGRLAFSGCTNLTSFTCMAVTPPTLGKSVGSIPFRFYNSTIYVPSESVEAYKTADEWKEYADRIKPIAD